MESIPKIWLMRQAGRYLTEYQEVRKSVPNFLELCYNPEKASLVTIQPIKKFNLSAGIVFSDILVTADSLGIKVEFKEGEGPILDKINTLEEAISIKTNEKSIQFEKVRKTIEITKKEIKNKPIIGFVGGAWTICAYILEGRGKNEFQNAVKKLYSDPKLVNTLIEKVTEQNIFYLRQQILGGAEIIQIFESHAGIVPPDKFDELIIKPTNIICKAIKSEFPKIKIIGFPRKAGYLYESFMEKTELDIIGCDQFVPLKKMSEWQKYKILQGNLDPLVLFSKADIIKEKVDSIMMNLDTDKLIFNLGHGILPNTPVENVKFLVDYVLSWKKQQ